MPFAKKVTKNLGKNVSNSRKPVIYALKIPLKRVIQKAEETTSNSITKNIVKNQSKIMQISYQLSKINILI